MKKLLAVLLVSAFVASCGTKADKGTVSKGGEIEREWVEEGVTKNYIFARGIGAADQTLDNKTQRMATSRNAAIVNAQYNMLSIIKGVQLEGGITVEKAIETDSLLATKIDAMIKGAQVVRTEWTNDDGCVVVLRLYKSALKDMGLKVLE
ncbi:MAG TPA: hypothetical protein PK103_04865 [Elusimicrobiales bacterium]|nr:hypothetical protein [Elusimicrobiales bacterium]HPO95020.1 hypothetical protein [Elusimicrobiales bacterium]